MDTRLAIDLWLETLQVEGRSPVTIRDYRTVTKRLPEVMPTLDPDAALALRRFLNEYREGRSPHTVRSTFATWRAFLGWCVREGLLSESPLRGMRTPRVPESTKDTYTTGQQKAMFAYLQGVRTPYGLRNHALCAVLADSGLRAGEVARLTLDDIVDGALLVRRSKGGRPRVVPLGERSQRAVSRYLTYGRPRLSPKCEGMFLNQFGQAFSTWGIQHVLAAVSRGVGFRISAHKFRHTAITTWLREGAPMETVRRLAGHSGYQVLLSYAHLTDGDLREAQRRWSPLDRL